jgi:hypothetical protein
MLNLDDDRWDELSGGYSNEVRPSPFPCDREATWHDIWDDLHHQGDVGEAWYAAVPHQVRIYLGGALAK